MYFSIGNYEKSLEILHYVYRIYIKNKNTSNLANILDAIADDLEHMGERYSEDYKKLYRQAYYVADFSDIDVVGVIDDSLYLEPSNNVIYNGDIIDDGESHGAEILEYLKDIGYSNSIFYYSAERDGIIESNSIVEGLNWMKQNKVKRINISLSSKKKSNDVEEWILKNSDIIVFCSYNNQINTYDYPAMLDGTISSGVNDGINYKENDVKYKSNRIIIINNGIKYYEGNSFLSIKTMLDY